MKARGGMKKMRVLFPLVALAGFVVLSTAVVLADSIPPGDPIIRVGGKGTALASAQLISALPGGISITSRIFTIVTPSGNSPTDMTDCILIQGGSSTQAPGCFFTNDIGGRMTGPTISSLLFVPSKAGFSGTLSCALSTALGGPGPWNACAATPATVAFYGGTGVPFGEEFSLGFRMFNANAAFLVTAVAVGPLAGTDPPVPEPGTLALFVGGIGALLVRRRSRAR